MPKIIYGGFNAFVRDWWRRDANGARVPYPGAPRRYLARGVTEEQARALCKEYNASHEPGWKSRKAEYEQA